MREAERSDFGAMTYESVGIEDIKDTAIPHRYLADGNRVRLIRQTTYMSKYLIWKNNKSAQCCQIKFHLTSRNLMKLRHKVRRGYTPFGFGAALTTME